jgi:hypothetical protein
MRVLLALVCIAAFGILGSADAAQRETIGIGAEHYGHEWSKARDELRGRRSYCRIIFSRDDGVLK